MGKYFQLFEHLIPCLCTVYHQMIYKTTKIYLHIHKLPQLLWKWGHTLIVQKKIQEAISSTKNAIKINDKKREKYWQYQVSVQCDERW